MFILPTWLTFSRQYNYVITPPPPSGSWVSRPPSGRGDRPRAGASGASGGPRGGHRGPRAVRKTQDPSGGGGVMYQNDPFCTNLSDLLGTPTHHQKSRWDSGTYMDLGGGVDPHKSCEDLKILGRPLFSI
jgi:hypothetical protein